MRVENSISVTKYIIIVPIIALLLLSFIFIVIVIDSQKDHLHKDLEETKSTYIKYQKQIIKNQVNQVIDSIEYREKLQDIPSNKIRKLLIKKLSQLRFGDKGYVYVINGSGKLLVHRNKTFINCNGFAIQDPTGKFYMKDGYKLSVDKGEGFLEYISVTNDDKIWNNRKKLTFVKYYPRYDWAISAGIYISDIDATLALRELDIKEHYKKGNITLIMSFIVVTFLVLIVILFLAKEIASRISQTSKELQNKVDEQTIELQMIVANKTIQNIEQTRIFEETQLENIKFTAIGHLAAGITHEINTPLAYIKGNFEMMVQDIKTLPDSETKTYLLEDSLSIVDGIKRISHIVESMREMSQKSKEIKEDTNIYHTLVTALTILFNRSKQITNITLNGEDFVLGFDKNKELFISCIQKQRVEQVWIVILNNALDELVKINNFEDRIIEIDIACNIDKKFIIVKIKDNAGGILKAIIDKIFDPFVSSKESSGMGVGLNIARKIIEEQEGKILAYNEDNGAVFEVHLPFGSCEI